MNKLDQQMDIKVKSLKDFQEEERKKMINSLKEEMNEIKTQNDKSANLQNKMNFELFGKRDVVGDEPVGG